MPIGWISRSASLALLLTFAAAASADDRPVPSQDTAVALPPGAQSPFILVTDTRVTLDGSPVEDARSLESAGRVARLDGLFARLAERRSAWERAHPGGPPPPGDAWVEVRSEAGSFSALSAILTVGFSHHTRLHLRTQTGWLDGELDVPAPPEPVSPELIHARVSIRREAGEVGLSWQSDAPCDAVPQDTAVAASALGAHLDAACRRLGAVPCIDTADLELGPRVTVAEGIATLDVIRHHADGSFHFSLSRAVVSMASTTTRRACGGPQKRHPTGLTDGQIRDGVKAHVGALRACYEAEAQRDPTLRGGLTLTWSVDVAGTVSQASVAQSTLNSPRVEGCILRQVKSWHFPASDRPTIIAAYPFRFGVSAN